MKMNLFQLKLGRKRKMNRLILLICLLQVNITYIIAQNEIYKNGLLTIDSLLSHGNSSQDLKKAVFCVENAFYDNQLDYTAYDKAISTEVKLIELISNQKMIDYNSVDFKSVNRHATIYRVMKDTLRFEANYTGYFYHYPLKYNFEDPNGKEDWTNMFTSSLIVNRIGNCHSLPLLYKLIANDLDEKAWLSLAPNHMYIKLHNSESGWFNVELTSGSFPSDSWIKSTGYIHIDAIKNGIYMDTLSDKQSIALCLIDLAEGYIHKNSEDFNPDYVLECCNKSLQYFPDYINALLLKSEILIRKLENDDSDNLILYKEAHDILGYIHKLGYRKASN